MNTDRCLLPSRWASRTMAYFIAGMGILFVGCGGEDNSLEGSIGESFPLHFDYVQTRLQGHDLLIEYIKEINGGAHKICKLVVDLEDLAAKPGLKLGKAKFAERVVVQRKAARGGEFPPAKTGKIKFKKLRPREGRRVDGEFETVFTNGRTLSGNFDAVLQVVPLD